jgi:hypothetical protein
MGLRDPGRSIGRNSPEEYDMLGSDREFLDRIPEAADNGEESTSYP